MSEQWPGSGERPFPSPPAHGGYPPPPGHPSGAPYPGPYGQHPGFPSVAAGHRPAPTRSRTPLILTIAAVGVVMVVVLALGAVLLAMRVGGGKTADGGRDNKAGSASGQPDSGQSAGGGQSVQAPGLYTLTLPAGFKLSKPPQAPGFLASASGPGGSVSVSNYYLNTPGGASVGTQESLEAAIMKTDGELIGSVADTQRQTIDNHLAVMYVGAQDTRVYVLVTGNQVIRMTCLGDLTSKSQANTKRFCTEVLASLKVG
jgi:hypothetical protein